MDRDNTKSLRLAAGLTVLLALGLAVMGVRAALGPAAGEPSGAGAWANAGLSVAVLLAALYTFLQAKGAVAPAAEAEVDARPVAPAVQPAPPPPRPATPEAEPGAEALMLLSLLQEKGRFVDFVMEDIAAYTNEQVGAAARVVHQGCRAVVSDVFAPLPVAPAENARITLEPGYDAGEFRLVGRAEGGPPYTVKVTHKGWRARHVKLPRRTAGEKLPETPIIVPAEVAA